MMHKIIEYFEFAVDSTLKFAANPFGRTDLIASRA